MYSVCKEGWLYLLWETAQLTRRAGMVSCSSAVEVGGGGGEDWWTHWLVNKGSSTYSHALLPKGQASFPTASRPHVVFWEPSKHPCFVVQTQYHNARSERLLLFLPRVVKHCKVGRKRLPVQMRVYCNCPILLPSVKMVDAGFYCTLELMLCYGIEVCLETLRGLLREVVGVHLPQESSHITAYPFCFVYCFIQLLLPQPPFSYNPRSSWLQTSNIFFLSFLLSVFIHGTSSKSRGQPPLPDSASSYCFAISCCRSS